MYCIIWPPEYKDFQVSLQLLNQKGNFLLFKNLICVDFFVICIILCDFGECSIFVLISDSFLIFSVIFLNAKLRAKCQAKKIAPQIGQKHHSGHFSGKILSKMKKLFGEVPGGKL